MEKITFTRKELYALVWSMPMTRLSKKYGISFHKLRRTCGKMDIPVPDYGHWMRIKHNKQIDIKELPTDFKSNFEVTFEIGDKNYEGEEEVLLERKKLIREINSNHQLPINVSSRLKNPDKLIIAAMNDLTPEKHPYGNYNGLMSTSGGIIDITVAPKNIQRALRFINTLIKLLKARGHDVRITDNGTCAIVFDEEITICLQEKLRIEESIDKYGWRSRKYFPSDILTFRMWIDFRFHQKVWGTGKHTIEELLPEILARVELLAKNEIQERIEREKRWKEQEEAEKIEQELIKQKKQEKKAVKELIRNAKKWRKANMLRDYIRAVEAKAIKECEMSDELHNWISWAKQVDYQFDPLRSK